MVLLICNNGDKWLTWWGSQLFSGLAFAEAWAFLATAGFLTIRYLRPVKMAWLGGGTLFAPPPKKYF